MTLLRYVPKKYNINITRNMKRGMKHVACKDSNPTLNKSWNHLQQTRHAILVQVGD